MKRKVVSCLLAMVMMIATVMPVSAEEVTLPEATEIELGEDGSASIDVGGIVQEPEIDVTVTAAKQIVLNPYKLAVTVDEEEVTASIIGVDTVITNNGATALYVDVTLTGTVDDESTATFLTADPATKAVTTKGVYMWGEFSAAYATDGEVSFTDNYDSKVDILVGTKPVTKTNAANIANAGDENANNVAFRLVGVANGNASEVWTDTDTVTVQVVFNFTPTTTGMVVTE